MSIRCITEPSPATEMINSGYGKISYQKWCELEMKRMNKKSDSVSLHVFDDGKIALQRG